MVQITAGPAHGALHVGGKVWADAHGGHKLMRVAVRPGGGNQTRHRASQPP